jgi:hypothetical protein
MTTEETTRMLERFFNAETTPQEERLLKDYLLGHDVPEALQADKALFCQLYDPTPAAHTRHGGSSEPRHQHLNRWKRAAVAGPAP